MGNNQCAAIVYGRTYEVDFRFIAVPKDFKKDDERWALDHISKTAQLPEDLKKAPIWSWFRNKDYWVFGVTCMARDLIGQETDVTRDSHKSPLYLFVGYAAKLDEKPDASSIPPYASDNLSLFRSAYKYVEEKWFEKNSAESRYIPIYTEYEKDFRSTTGNDIDTECEKDFRSATGNDSGINTKQDKILIFPDTEENRRKLWQAGADLEGVTSICLGLQSRKNIENSPFLNVTQPGLAQKEEISRHRADEEEKRNPEGITDDPKDGYSPEPPQDNYQREFLLQKRDAPAAAPDRKYFDLGQLCKPIWNLFLQLNILELFKGLVPWLNIDESRKEDEKTLLLNGTEKWDEMSPEEQRKYREQQKMNDLKEVPKDQKKSQNSDSHQPKADLWSVFSQPPVAKPPVEPNSPTQETSEEHEQGDNEHEENPSTEQKQPESD